LARQRLLMLMGVQFSGIPAEPVVSHDRTNLAISADDLANRALSSRPDLSAAHLAIVANEQRVRLARYDFLNVTAILPDLNSKGEKGFEAGPGLVMTLPLFNQNQGVKARAAAQLEKSHRNFNNVRNNVLLEVQQAYVRFVRSQQELDSLRRDVLPEAHAGLQRMQRALNEDAISPLIVMQTTDQYLIAHRLEIDAAAESRRAAAELERSVGWRVFNQPQPHTEEISLSQAATRTYR